MEECPVLAGTGAQHAVTATLGTKPVAFGSGHPQPAVPEPPTQTVPMGRRVQPCQ